ncbi:MAG: response regulator, partial [Candidatus Omnitrophica bacterium]|nr:response regulator [Candidatus Omnitrophota bacterium]
LLGNAVKFTEKGEIKVTVRALGEISPVGRNQEVEISVKDTGIGIPEDKLGAIFEVFTQADDSTTRKFGGTGLGLSIARALAQKMGGDIRVRSGLGQGSEFNVNLQLEAARPVNLKDITLINFDKLRGIRVAIIDDNENALRLLETYCKEGGLEVVFKADRVAKLLAWVNADQNLPQIILSDIMMPEMDGMALAKRLREDKRYDQVKLIAVTSDARPGTAEEAGKSGFDAYLPKPVFRKELMQVIQTVLGDKRQEKVIITRHIAGELALKGLRVLVVEDQTTNQKLMKVYLDMFGCNSDFANNGKEVSDQVFHVKRNFF